MEEANVIKDASKAMISVNSSQDKSDTALLMMSHDMNWGEFLTPAPMSIALLGQLMLIAGEKDFSLSKPEKGFQYIHHPESFRACLVQVSNSGWTAFNEAHKNMDAIQLYAAQVPDRVKRVVRYLINGSKEDVEDFLPIELGKIEKISTECLKLAESVEKKFEEVMLLTGELLEVSSAAKGHYKRAQDEAKRNREIAMEKEKMERQRMDAIKKQQQDLQNQVKEAKRGWEKAVDSMPSGWDMIGMQVVETLTNTFSAVVQGVMPPYGTKTPTSTGPGKLPTKKVPKQRAEDKASMAFYEGSQVKDQLIQLSECLDAAAENPRDSAGNISETLMHIRLLLQSFNEDLKTDSPVNKEFKKILDESQEICRRGEAWFQQLNHSPDEIKAISIEASKLKMKAIGLCVGMQSSTGGNPLYSKPPRQAQRVAGSAGNSAPASAVNAVVEGARLKITESRQLLEKQEERYDKTCDDLKQSNANLQKVLEDLAKFSPEVIADFDKIRETLTKGMKALASVREQWQKLVEFFQFITNIVKVCMKESLSTFVEYAKKGKERALRNGYSDTDFIRDLIYEQVNKANTTCYVVWSLANTYVKISHKYLMSRLASLGHLVALDPEKDRQEIITKRKELREGCEEAQQAIMFLVLEAKDEFHAKVKKRVSQIERQLVSALPPPKNPEKNRQLEDAVKKGIEAGTDTSSFTADDF